MRDISTKTYLIGVLTLLVIGALVALAGRKAHTDPYPALACRCVVRNETCFVVRACAGVLTPEQRVDRINERLAVILGEHSRLVRVAPAGESVAIYVGQTLLVTVTPADAKRSGATVRELAAKWAGNLRKALR